MILASHRLSKHNVVATDHTNRDIAPIFSGTARRRWGCLGAPSRTTDASAIINLKTIDLPTLLFIQHLLCLFVAKLEAQGSKRTRATQLSRANRKP